MKTKRKGMSYAKWGYIFLAPFFITFFIFQFWPLATTIYYSFFEYFRSGLKIIGPNFVGLKNYAAMIQEVPKYFSNTMIMWLMGFIPQIIVSLVLAAWFTDLRLKLRFQGFFKTVIYMPNLIMASAFAMLFFTLFSNSETGPINSILLKLGIVAEPVRWLSNVWTARGLVGLMNFLMWFGNTTIILMAAIMGVDPGLYEAAQLDGASSTTMFWRITIPLIRPLLVYTLITSLIGGLQMFDVPQVLTNGKGDPNGSTNTIIMYLNQHLYSKNYGTAGAISVLMGMGILKQPFSFLNTVWGNRGLIGLMNFLMWFGNTTIMLMAAIMGVDPTLYEAAELDGCTPNQMFWKITIPLIRPILVYVMITSMIGGLQMFDVPQILTNGKGGPDRTSTTMIMYLNNHLFSKNYGMAGAVSVVLFLVCAVLCVVVYVSLTREDDGRSKAERKALKGGKK